MFFGEDLGHESVVSQITVFEVFSSVNHSLGGMFGKIQLVLGPSV